MVLTILAIAALAQAPDADVIDSGEPDASVNDAGTLDAGLPDAGPVDAGVPDAGKPPPPPWTYPVAFPYEQATPVRRENVDAETRVLIDRAHAGADKAQLAVVNTNTNLEAYPHRHAKAAEIVFVLAGSGRVRGANFTWQEVKAGDAIYSPPGVAHGYFWNKGTRVLILEAPPEDDVPVPASELKKPNKKAPQPTVIKKDDAAEYEIAGGKAKVRMYAPDGALAYVGILHGNPGFVVPEHAHENEAEVLFVTRGTGVLTVDGKPNAVAPGVAVHVPPAHRHSFKANGEFEAVQFYSPAGPEQRFKPAK